MKRIRFLGSTVFYLLPILAVLFINACGPGGCPMNPNGTGNTSNTSCGPGTKSCPDGSGNLICKPNTDPPPC